MCRKQIEGTNLPPAKRRRLALPCGLEPGPRTSLRYVCIPRCSDSAPAVCTLEKLLCKRSRRHVQEFKSVLSSTDLNSRTLENSSFPRTFSLINCGKMIKWKVTHWWKETPAATSIHMGEPLRSNVSREQAWKNMRYDSACAKFRNRGEETPKKSKRLWWWQCGKGRGRDSGLWRASAAPGPLCFPGRLVGTWAFFSLFQSHTYDFINSYMIWSVKL